MTTYAGVPRIQTPADIHCFMSFLESAISQMPAERAHRLLLAGLNRIAADRPQFSETVCQGIGLLIEDVKHRTAVSDIPASPELDKLASEFERAIHFGYAPQVQPPAVPIWHRHQATRALSKAARAAHKTR